MKISGSIDDKRLSSQLLEENIQQALREGARNLEIESRGQHGIGGRIWPKYSPVTIKVKGPVGQRLGAMGMFGTEIVVSGSASDDVGWLNCGARITVLGDVTNGAHNAGAQGILYVQGGGGARCDTMTKHNPRFEPLQSWYFRDVGDSFAEFKAGGIAVVCGVNPRRPENILGYRPCVGMVGGTVYFRGKVEDYSKKDVQLLELNEADWRWLKENMKSYLSAIDRLDYLDQLSASVDDWRKLVAYTPEEKKERAKNRLSTKEYRLKYWEQSVGKGGIFAEMIDHPTTLLPFVASGENRLFFTSWQNEKQLAPCVAYCPSDIPSHKRFMLLRQGRLAESMALVLRYSPFPATICGIVCPNICMKACSRKLIDTPLDIKTLGRASSLISSELAAKPASGKKIAVVGAGAAGLSAAWQLCLQGHQVEVYEQSETPGGALRQAALGKDNGEEVFAAELNRISDKGVEIRCGIKVDAALFSKLLKENDGIVVACGAKADKKDHLDFLPAEVERAKGRVKINQTGQTAKPMVFAAGTAVAAGIATNSVGSGRRSALALDALLSGKEYQPEKPEPIPYEKLNLVYFDKQEQQPTARDEESKTNGLAAETGLKKQLVSEAQRCISCGLCRDCRLCEASCYQGAISRTEHEDGSFSYQLDESRCIGCGFCVAVCPCGIWRE